MDTQTHRNENYLNVSKSVKELEVLNQAIVALGGKTAIINKSRKELKKLGLTGRNSENYVPRLTKAPRCK